MKSHFKPRIYWKRYQSGLGFWCVLVHIDTPKEVRSIAYKMAAKMNMSVYAKKPIDNFRRMI